jgi:hypothetical protein
MGAAGGQKNEKKFFLPNGFKCFKMIKKHNLTMKISII